MNPFLTDLLGAAVSFGGAAIFKTVAKSKNSTIYQWGAPVAAAAIGIGFEAATGAGLDSAALVGAEYGAAATWLQSVYKGAGRDRRARTERRF